jgi:hypothetical protein
MSRTTRGTIRSKLGQIALALAMTLPAAAIVTTTADVAVAQQPNAKAQKDAKVAYDAGKLKMDQGNYAGALPDFQRADALWPGAAPKYNIALCYDKLGRNAEAIAAYRTFINSNPGAKYADRVVAAGRRISELEGKLEGTVALAVTPPNIQGMTVKIDGAPAAAGPELKVPPGRHTIEIVAPGYQPFKQEVDVVGGQRLDLPVTLTPAPVTPPPQPKKKSNKTANALRIAGFVTLGVTVVGGVLTTAFGVMALGNASDFDETPTEELADDAERNALIADVSLGVTGAAGIATIILLAAGFSMKSEQAGIEIVPQVGENGGGATLSVSF